MKIPKNISLILVSQIAVYRLVKNGVRLLVDALEYLDGSFALEVSTNF